MTPIQESNILIDRWFKGRELIPNTKGGELVGRKREFHDGWYDMDFVFNLQYDSNWEVLMEVVEFIEAKGYAFEIIGKTCICWDKANGHGNYNNDKPLFFNRAETKKISTYQSVLQFIRDYVIQ